MAKYVRVKDRKTGHEFSWPAHLVEGVEGIDVLDRPATDANGERLPVKHRTTVAKSAAARKKHSAPKAPTTVVAEYGQQAETPKEND